MSITRMRSAVEAQWTVLTNAASLAATTVGTAALGVAFWAVTTRSLDQAQVGAASALVSAMTLVATIAMLGYGSLLISELPRRVEKGTLIATVAVAVAVLGVIVGAVWAAALRHSHNLAHLVTGPGGFTLFVAGCALTALTFVLDQATIGLLRGALQMWRNLFHSVIKIVLLVPLLMLGGSAHDDAPLTAWVVGTALSVPFMLMLAKRLRLAFWGPLQPRLLVHLGRETWNHTMLTLAMVAPRMGLPVVVAVAVSAKANGAFYIAYTLSTMLAMIPNHLATVLFAIGRGDSASLRPKLAFTLGLSFALGLPAALATAVLAKLLLSIFGHAYAAAGVVPLLWLTATFPASVIRLHYAAVQRVRGQLTRAWQLLLVGGVAEVLSVSWFGHAHGLDAAMAAFCVVVTVEGLVTLPTVLAALRPPTRLGAGTDQSASTRSGESQGPSGP